MAGRTAMMMVILGILVNGCGTKDEPYNDFDTSVGDGGLGATGVVYSSNEAQLKPILDLYCVPCHSSMLTGTDRGGAPISINYDTYEAAVQNAVSGNRAVQAGSMPPSGNQLTVEEKRLFQLWVDTGLN